MQTLIGQRSGKLTYLSGYMKDGAKWARCRCECGQTVHVTLAAFRAYGNLWRKACETCQQKPDAEIDLPKANHVCTLCRTENGFRIINAGCKVHGSAENLSFARRAS